MARHPQVMPSVGRVRARISRSLDLRAHRAQCVGMREREPVVDWDKVEEMSLALLHLTTFEEHGRVRAWKGHAWEVLNRLHEHGWLGDPVGKAKSVAVTDEGARRARELFQKYFVKAG